MMKPLSVAMMSVLVSTAVVHTAVSGVMAPIAAKEPEPPDPKKTLIDAPLTPGESPYRAQDGVWYMPAKPETPIASSASVFPQSTGGPDDFGYTWSDSVALNWIDATGGTDTGMSGSSWGQSVGPIALPFAFEFYENTYTEVHIAASGYLAFTDQPAWPWQSPIPSPGSPNNVVAPFWTPLDLASEGGVNRVYHVSGGVAPNRYFVVEWNEVGSGDEQYTFEVVLYENGDILFQYKTMTYNGGYACAAAGIEDSAGLDGLSYLDRCEQASSHKAVRFYRPAPAARVGIWPLHQGRFAHAGETVAFEVPVRNTGDLGGDTYDLFVTSPWSVLLHGADGATLLTDTDGDGAVDTGGIAQGSSTTIMARIDTPAVVNVGDDNTAAITFRSSLDTGESKTVELRTGVPAPFAQVYEDGADWAMSLYLVQPDAQAVKKATPDQYYGDEMAVAEMGDGFAYFWTKYRWTGGVGTIGIDYTLLDRYGEPMQGLISLTDHSGATLSTYDYDPAVAVAPNGRIGVLWRRHLHDASSGTGNHNVFFAILDGSGVLSFGPVNLTNNGAWGGSYTEGVPQFYEPRIAATRDNRFVMAWRRSVYTDVGRIDDILYSIRDESGSAIKPATELTSATPGFSAHRDPAITSLSSSRAFLSWVRRADQDDRIYYAVIDSEGNVVKLADDLSVDGDVVDWRNYDAVELSNGRILAIWEAWGCFPDEWVPRVRFALLDGAYNRIGTPVCLGRSAAAAGGDRYVSVSADVAGHGILTWMDGDWVNRRNLYYALVDGTGSVLTDPMIFRTSQATAPYISTSDAGYGNTSYGLVTPTTDDVDAWVTSSLVGAAPGGIAAIPASIGNHGSTLARSLVLTATLDGSLSYLDASPVPVSASADTLVWNLSDIGFLGSGRVDLHTEVPSSTIGTRYPVTWTVASTGPEADASNNTATAVVMVARQVFLPLVFRGY